MDILIICLLLLATVVLLLIELFIVPGISIAGILAGGCAIFVNYYAFTYLGIVAGIITLNITSQIDRSAEMRIKIGDIGITTTRLALIGYAKINDEIVEVKSTGELLNEHTCIRVVRIVDGTIMVEKAN